MSRYDDLMKAAEAGRKAKGPSRAELVLTGASAPAALPRARTKPKTNEKGQNKTEAAYEAHLELLKAHGEIVAFWWGAITLKIGHDCRYVTDFLVQLPDGSLEIHETKGFMEDDALVKLKVVRAMFPFPVILVKKKAGAWELKEFKPW